MRTNSIPLSRNGRRAMQTRLGGRRAQPAAPRASRYQRWIAGIVAKYLNHIAWRGGHAGAMALLHPDRQTLLRLQTIVRQAEPRAASTMPAALDARAPQVIQILQRQFAQPWIFVQHPQSARRIEPRYFAARELPYNDKSKLQASAPPPPIRMFRIKERSMVERIMLRTTASEPVHDSGRLPLSVAERRTGRRSRVVTEDEAPTLPERVIRRLRRVEERPLHPARQAAVRMPAATTPEEAPAARRQRRDVSPQGEPSFETHTAGRHAQQPAAVNVGQITDAVLQQLDRRLLAARERMGRI